MKKIDYEHFSRFVKPQAVAVRGEDVYFSVQRTSLKENRYYTDLYRLRGEKVTRLTALGDIGGWRLTDKGIELTLKRTPEDQGSAEGLPHTVFYLLPYDGGEAVPVFSIDKGTGEMIPAGEDRYLFTAGEDLSWNELLRRFDGDTAAALAQKKADADYQVIDEIPFYLNGSGFTNKHRGRVYLWDRGEITPVTPEQEDAGIACALGEKLLVTRKDLSSGVDPLTNRLYLLDRISLEFTDISFSGSCLHRGALTLPDGRVFCAIDKAEHYGLEENPVFALYENGAWRVINDSGECSFSNTVTTDVTGGGPGCGSRLPVKDGAYYFLDTVNDHTALSKMDLETGAVTRINAGDMAISTFDFLPGGGYVISAVSPDKGSEIYRMEEDGSVRVLTHCNDALTSEYDFSRPEPISFKNEVGTEIFGWVIKPADFDPAKKYPGILTIHGGPKVAFGPAYYHEMQLWASRGFFVFFCNPTGGDGRGNEFADIRGRYGDIDYRDLMTFTDTVLAAYPALDEKRLGITGGSYGGFMVNWVIGHTHRFAAAASQRSIANWLGFFNQGDIGYFFAGDQTAADPWTDPEKMWQQSPVKYAPNAKTPTLFIHSEEDYRCPLAEGLQMFTALRLHGVETRLCLFKGEHHGLSRGGKPTHRIRRLKEITEWLEHYLMPEESAK